MEQKHDLEELQKTLRWALYLAQEVDGSITELVQLIGKAVEMCRECISDYSNNR